MIMDFFLDLFDIYLCFLPLFFILGFISVLYVFITDFKDLVPLQGLFDYIFMHIFLFICVSLVFPFVFVLFIIGLFADLYDSLNEKSKRWFN